MASCHCWINQNTISVVKGPTSHPYWFVLDLLLVFVSRVVEVLSINTVNIELYWYILVGWLRHAMESDSMPQKHAKTGKSKGLSLFSLVKWLQCISFGFIIVGIASMSWHFCIWVVRPLTFHAQRWKAARDIHQKEATWQQPTWHEPP